jgi:hypothetical protein
VNQSQSRARLASSILLIIVGAAVVYYVSSGFSGSADFRGGSGSIIANSLLPAFILGLIMFAFGLIELASSAGSRMSHH